MSLILPAAAYLLGSVPFGYLIGRARGVDLFKAGSGNIGATNAARVLGWRWGALCFALDFGKGALPAAFAAPLAAALGEPDAGALPVLCGALAFLGHMFPVYLGFRGGKGVATGAGAVAALAPLPAAVGILTWLLVLLTSRYVAAASVAAAFALFAAHLATAAGPWPLTAFLAAGALIVTARHRGNFARLRAGTEPPGRDFRGRWSLVRGLHAISLGLWCGGAAFFNFVAAPAIFASFTEVVANAPSDRTAGVPIVPADAPDATRKALASALAGSAVGPIFPRYFAWQAVCGGVALATALGLTAGRPFRGVARWRVLLIGAACLLVAVGWPLSGTVSELRLARFAADPAVAAVAAAAKAAFGPWHLLSLALSALTTLLTAAALALAGLSPESPGSVPAPLEGEPGVS